MAEEKDEAKIISFQEKLQSKISSNNPSALIWSWSLLKDLDEALQSCIDQE
ncbi:MAG: hypothetical protein AAGK97_05850 [Bacteroidota bacterium]